VEEPLQTTTEPHRRLVEQPAHRRIFNENQAAALVRAYHYLLSRAPKQGEQETE
jgi:hypothetical protein